MLFPFENDTRKIVKRLSSRSLQADRRRNLFVMVAIALAAALMAGICFYATAQSSKLIDDIRGQYQAVCVESDQTLIDQLSQRPEVEQWGVSKTMGSARYQDTVLSVSYEDQHQMKLARRPDYEGTLPQTAQEIMVERDFLRYLQLPEKTGQILTMDLGDGVQRDYTVTAILNTENSSRMFNLFVSRAYVEEHADGEPVFDFRIRLADGDEEDMDHLKEQIADFFVSQGVDQDRIFYSSNYFDMQDFHTRDTTEVYVVSLMVVLACGLVIYSLFYISVAGKMREYGRLKVIGATPRQLKQVVFRECRSLAFRAIPVGIIVGGAAMYLWYPEYWSWLDNLPYAIGVAVVLFLAIAVSVRVPVQMAGRVSAIEAVRSNAYSQQIQKGFSKALHRSLTPSSMAGMYFKRNRKKSVLTFCSLGLTGLMLMCAATMAVSFDVDSMAANALGDGGHYHMEISGDSMEEVQQLVSGGTLLNDQLYEELMQVEGVDCITRYQAVDVNIALPKETAPLTVTGLTQAQMEQFLPADFMEQGQADYQELNEKNGIIIDDGSEKLLELYYGYTPQLGDVLTITPLEGGEPVELQVLGIAKETIKTGVGASLFLTTPEILQKIYPEAKNFDMVWNIHMAADSREARDQIFQLANDGRITISTRQDYADSFQDSMDWLMASLYLLTGFLFLFAMLNLVNTLATGLLAKGQELGILQSVGMTRRQLSSMLSSECLWYVVITMLITLGIGTPLGLIMCRVFTQVGVFGTLTYHFPWQGILIYGALLAAIWLVYRAIAVRYLQRQSLVERIKNTD